MKKKLLFVLLIFSLIAFPFFNNDYIDITHMAYISSIGVSYDSQTNNTTFYALIINKYSMGKSEYNTSSEEISKVVINSGKTLQEAYYNLLSSIHVVIDFNHVESLIINTSYYNIEELVSFFNNNQKFYNNFNIFITEDYIEDIYRVDYLNDVSSYYTLINERKSDVEYHHSSLIDLANDYYISNYFCLYPSIKTRKNIVGKEDGISIFIDGYYYLKNNQYQKLNFSEYSLLHLIYSSKNITFEIDDKSYKLLSYSVKRLNIFNKMFFMYFVKSNYKNNLKDILYNFIKTMYEKKIDLLNLDYFDISIDDLVIINVEKSLIK